jgi:hypothetical protein
MFSLRKNLSRFSIIARRSIPCFRSLDSGVRRNDGEVRLPICHFGPVSSTGSGKGDLRETPRVYSIVNL